MLFEQYAAACKEIARDLHTICEVREYRQYGWASIAFMTDKFGGTYVNLHYDLRTGAVVNWYGHEDAREVKSLAGLTSLVKEELGKMLKARDLSAVYEMVNAEY